MTPTQNNSPTSSQFPLQWPIQGSPPLFLDQIFFGDRLPPPPPYLRAWMAGPLPFLRVWIRHCFLYRKHAELVRLSYNTYSCELQIYS